jgi:alpha-L-rhamnosidase
MKDAMVLGNLLVARLTVLLSLMVGINEIARKSLPGATTQQSSENTPLNEKFDHDGQSLQQTMIWASEFDDRSNEARFVAFRKQFNLFTTPATAPLRIFADVRYLLWINGQYILRGPARFDPKGPEYDRVDVGQYLRLGKNAIAIVVMGEASNGRMMRHLPCLTARLDVTEQDGTTSVIVTDATWKWSDKTRYRSPRVEWGNIHDRIDARVEDGDWTKLDYNDSTWKPATSVDGAIWGPLTARRIPLLRETLLETRLAGNRTLPLTLTTGQEVHIDVGQLSQAYSVLDLDADAGTDLELKHAGIEYIARQGRQTYITSDTCAFNDAVISVKSGRATIHSFEAVEVLYPFDCIGSFHCSDDRLNRIWKMGVRSLQLTSEDAYVDCADRERTEWMDCDPPAFDVTRTTMAATGFDGKLIYADPRLLEEMLRRIALSRQSTGWVKAHTCSDRFDIHAYMEDRSCDWVEGARRYYESTGNAGPLREIWPVIVSQMNWFLNHRTSRGLVRAREWIVWGNPVGYQTFEGAGLNAFVYRALTDAAYLGDVIGERADAAKFARAADELSKAVNQVLWNQVEGTYFSGFYADYEKTLADPKARKLDLKIENGLVASTFFPALFAMDQGIVPESRRKAVMRYLLSHRDQASRVMTFYYLYKQLYDADQPAFDQEVLDSIAARFLPMADTGWHVSWEEFNGASKAHAYGMYPSYFLSAYCLGVRPDGPVWSKRVLIEPRLADLASAEGTVVTEFGPVAVAWKHRGETLAFSIEVPKGIEARLRLPDADAPTLRFDGKPADAQIEGRYAVTELPAEKCEGTILVKALSTQTQP